MYAKVMLVGNTGSDPSMRYTPNGTAVTEFSLATSSREKDGEGWNQVTQWWRVKVFGKQAEVCNQYLSKGKRVLVEGEIKIRTYEKKDGSGQGVSVECIASHVVFLSPKDSDGQPESGGVTDAETEIAF